MNLIIGFNTAYNETNSTDSLMDRLRVFVCYVGSHDDVSIQENAGMASAVLDILSTCLIGSDSWLTLPAAMTLARLTISYFLNM